MVMALMGDDNAVALTLVLGEEHDPRVLLRTQENVRGVSGEELLEGGARGLVGAVLGPLGVEDVDLADGGVAADKLGHAPGLVGGETHAKFLQLLLELVIFEFRYGHDTVV